MCPEEQPRPFLTHRPIDKARYEAAIAVAELYVWFGSQEERRLFESRLLAYDTRKDNRPYKPKAKRKTLRRVGQALADLISALEDMDFESRARLSSYLQHMDPAIKEMLAKSEIGLNHWFLFQELTWIRPAWNAAIDMYISELPANSPTGRDKATHRDELISELRAFFRTHGRPARGKSTKDREQRFVNAILEAIDETAVSDVAERVREFTRKKKDAHVKATQAKAEKRANRTTEKPEKKKKKD
jgi:hypothetical protein